MKYRRHEKFERELDRRSGEEKLSVYDVAGPSRRHRSFGWIDVFGLRCDSTAGLLAVLGKRLKCWLASGRARVSAVVLNLRRGSFPNQSLQRNAYDRPLSAFLSPPVRRC